jgi:hypothetical protein
MIKVVSMCMSTVSCRRVVGTFIAIALAGFTFGGCADRLRVSIGTRVPPELRGASSVQVTEQFSRVARGEDLSVVATLMDFSYLRAITRERDRAVDREREDFEHYLRGRTSFYVYLVLHEADVCRTRSRSSSRRMGGQQERLDLQSWTFTLRTSSGQDLDAAEIDPGSPELAPTGGCIVHGYVQFDRPIPRDARWITLDASVGRGDEEMHSELRWEIDPWSPPRRAPRRPEDSTPRSPSQEDSSS